MKTLSYLVLCVCKQITSQCVGFTPTCLKLCFVDSNFLQTIIISQTASLPCFHDVSVVVNFLSQVIFLFLLFQLH